MGDDQIELNTLEVSDVWCGLAGFTPLSSCSSHIETDSTQFRTAKAGLYCLLMSGEWVVSSVRAPTDGAPGIEPAMVCFLGKSN